MRTSRCEEFGRSSRLALVLALVLVTAPAGADPATAQDAACVDLCAASCIKPWSIPDRWDDVTGIPGYMGEAVSGRVRRPDWRNNYQFDFESFTDLDRNRRWEPGEPYVDGNGNGQYDQENYHPSLTGYGASAVPGNFFAPEGDLGLEITLHPTSTYDPPAPGQYYGIDLPPINKGTPVPGSDEFRQNIANCNPVLVERGDWLQLEPGLMTSPTNQGMRDRIAQDPNAAWDDATRSVINSAFSLSPRVVFLPVHDPRIPLSSNGYSVQVTKVVAFFMEHMTGPAEVRGRFLRVQLPEGAVGAACAPGQAGGFIIDCPVPARAATWGRVKGTYR